MPKKNSTHSEYMGEGYRVTIQHCVECDEYLGVNYPDDYCNKCKKLLVTK